MVLVLVILLAMVLLPPLLLVVVVVTLAEAAEVVGLQGGAVEATVVGAVVAAELQGAVGEVKVVGALVAALPFWLHLSAHRLPSLPCTRAHHLHGVHLAWLSIFDFDFRFSH